MTESLTFDVLICGAGAAGLTLAIELARRNVSFLLIEKAEGPLKGSRGKGIQPRTLEVFGDLGIVDRIVARGGLYPTTREYGGDGFKDSDFSEQREPSPNEPYGRPLMLPQFLTEATLRERLTELGQCPRFGSELKGFDQDPEGVSARVGGATGEETVLVRYLVGTDGGRSFVRHALNIGFAGRTLDVRAVVADVTLEGLARDVWHRWSTSPKTSMSLCPLAGTDLFQLQALIPLEGEPELSSAELTAMIAKRTGRGDIIVRSVSWCSAYIMSARLADRYQVGRVFLAGDAAHIHPPTGGQGLNTSVQDSYNLGWKLAAVLKGAPKELLETYEAERRAIAANMLGLSTSLLNAAQERGEMRRGRDAQQLDIGYPDSTLSLERALRATGTRAGDRAPDAPCRGAAGLSTRLFNLYQGPHWTILGYEVDCTSLIQPRSGLRIHSIGKRGDIVDDDGHIQRAYDLSPGDLVLVRPDGYVGAIVTSGEAAALSNYLDGVGLFG